jgi:hypothetical protein
MVQSNSGAISGNDIVILQRWLWKGILPLAIGALIFLLGWSQSLLRPSADPKNRGLPQQAVPQPISSASSPLVGSASCTGRGCHGSIEPVMDPADTKKIQQNEYSLWAHDPHANSYLALFNPRSQQISKLLAGPSNPTPAHQDSRCLACHANPQVALLPSFAKEEQSFGIGCESCHGSAKKWLVPHTDKAWRTHLPQQKWEQFQMVPLTDLAKRAETCAGCHVGARADPAKKLPRRDVNHDLLAAGHPRLNFELGAFQAHMPAHWRSAKTAEGHLWAVGQIASAQAALDLLIHRAETGERDPLLALRASSAKSAPWPEFAEYDCFACHHSLDQPSWRQKDDRPGRKPGVFQRDAWGSWYFALTRQIADDQPNAGAVHEAMDHLEEIMQRPYPDPALAARSAKKARAELQETAKGLARWQDEAFARKRILEIIKNDRPPISWDSAEQRYLALHAMHPSPALNALAKDRAFRPRFDGPGQSFHPRGFLEKLKALPKN